MKNVLTDLFLLNGINGASIAVLTMNDVKDTVAGRGVEGVIVSVGVRACVARKGSGPRWRDCLKTFCVSRQFRPNSVKSSLQFYPGRLTLGALPGISWISSSSGFED